MLNDIRRCQKNETTSTEAEEYYPTHIPRLLFGGANAGYLSGDKKRTGIQYLYVNLLFN